MATVSLYRKYRSQTFGDLIGQDHVIKTLQNGIDRGRIAHAYLFTGPRGTGKTSTARLLAKALCATDGPTSTPREDDPICMEIAAGNFIDVIELDAASESGVDDVRERIVEVAEYRPMVARYKVFIIDEVHDLSTKAFDALLKTIEEPPEHLIFILATTEYHKVPPTIRSRCQKYEFHRATVSDLVGRLQYVAEQEKVEIEPAAVSAIARMADGGFRDALTLLEQAILTTEDRITLQQVYDQLGLVREEDTDRLLLGIKRNEIPTIIQTLESVVRLGRDPRSILESAMHRLSELTRASFQLDTGLDPTRDAALFDTAANLGRDVILKLRGQFAEAHRDIRDVTIPRIWLEAELVRMAGELAAPAAPANTAAASVPVKPAPAVVPAKPAPVAKAPEITEPVVEKPVPVVEETPVEVPMATTDEPEPEAPIPTETTELDPWQRVLAAIPDAAKAHRIKLQNSRLIKDGGSYLQVELALPFHLDWFKEKPQRVGYLVDVAKSALGREVRLDLEAGKRQAPAIQDDGAVELPLEGKRLEQLAREIFGIDPPRDEP
jgi:DNA polymerase-3 subunit gamma/tau